MASKEAEPVKVAVVQGLPRKVDGIPPKQFLSQFDSLQSVLIDKEKKALKHLLLSNQQLFTSEPCDRGSTEVVTHTIRTGDTLPQNQVTRRLPRAH